MTTRRDGGRVLLEDIIGSRVLTAEGREVGRVTDMEASVSGEREVKALVVGVSGWLHRLHVDTVLRRHVAAARELPVIPWSSVDAWDGLVVRLRPGVDATDLDHVPRPRRGPRRLARGHSEEENATPPER